MEQQKIGNFLKQLRKEKGLTQEQFAERFYISSRTVSRWETGSNMPDVDMLIELADFYEVDIREIIDGERKSENMDNETKATLKKVAKYATEENQKRYKRLSTLLAASIALGFVCYLLFGSNYIRPTSYLTKRSTTVGKRNLLSLKTITSRLSPVSYSMKQTAF